MCSNFLLYSILQQEYEITPEDGRLKKAEEILEKYLHPDVSVYYSALCN